MVSTSEWVLVYEPCLGTAQWWYMGKDYKTAGASFIVYSVAKNKQDPLTLTFNHTFFSLILTKAENDTFIKDITAVLKTINAKNITSRVVKNSSVVQTIYVDYKIEGVKQSNVDTLTSAIASVCSKAIEDIASKHHC